MEEFVVDKQQQKRREQIGVFVFILAIGLIFGAVIGYLFAGHSFDVAASNIDSNVGQLDGYFTVVFDGDNVPLPKKLEIPERILKKATDFLDIDNNQNTQNEEIKTEKATIANVSLFFKDKGSTICKIKSCDYTAYSQGEIFERDNWKLGVISVDPAVVQEAISTNSETPSIKEIRSKIKKMRRQDEANLIFILATDQKFVKFLEDDADCFICKNTAEDVPEAGKQVGKTYVMRVPDKDTIGSVLSTPAKMLTGFAFTKVETS